jgi:hypothetical protein
MDIDGGVLRDFTVAIILIQQLPLQLLLLLLLPPHLHLHQLTKWFI